MISLEGSHCLIFATVQLTLLLKLATNAYLEIKSKSFGWNWFSSYQLIVYIEREMTTLLCNECGKSFTDEPLLYIHQTRQPDKTSHSCGECSTEVIGKMALKRLSWTICCFFSIKKIIKTFRVKFDLRLSLPRGAWIVTESRYTSLSSKILTKTPRILYRLIQLMLKNWWICPHSTWRGHLSFL